MRPTTNTVLVTGASSGIGKACALRLDQEGFRVFAGVRRDEDSIMLREQASPRLTPIFLDVTDIASLNAARDTVMSLVGEAGLAGIVNNAGVAVAGPLEFLPIAELRLQLEVNVSGQIAAIQAFLPLLRQGQGRIINIGSLGGRIAMPFLGPYCATKFALEALTDALRIELRPWHIPVCLIEPGFIATPIWEKARQTADLTFNSLSPQAHTLYGTLIPKARKKYARLGATGTPPEEVVKVILHALTASRPRTRYLVGRGSLLGSAILAHLPDRLRDLLISYWLKARA